MHRSALSRNTRGSSVPRRPAASAWISTRPTRPVQIGGGGGTVNQMGRKVRHSCAPACTGRTTGTTCAPTPGRQELKCPFLPKKAGVRRFTGRPGSQYNPADLHPCHPHPPSLSIHCAFQCGGRVWGNLIPPYRLQAAALAKCTAAIGFLSDQQFQLGTRPGAASAGEKAISTHGVDASQGEKARASRTFSAAADSDLSGREDRNTSELTGKIR